MAWGCWTVNVRFHFRSKSRSIINIWAKASKGSAIVYNMYFVIHGYILRWKHVQCNMKAKVHVLWHIKHQGILNGNMLVVTWKSIDFFLLFILNSMYSKHLHLSLDIFYFILFRWTVLLLFCLYDCSFSRFWVYFYFLSFDEFSYLVLERINIYLEAITLLFFTISAYEWLLLSHAVMVIFLPKVSTFKNLYSTDH